MKKIKVKKIYKNTCVSIDMALYIDCKKEGIRVSKVLDKALKKALIDAKKASKKQIEHDL